MKLITDFDKIHLSHLDILKIKTAPKGMGNGIILSKMISYDKDLAEEDLDMLNIDYGIENELV